MKKLSCIIPAYNEGERISKVLEVVSIHPLITEVIIIDDGSADDTKNVIEEFSKRFKKLKLILHKHNRGKSASLYEGIKQATGDFVFFLDADLVGLTADDITDLISPIKDEIADVSMSLRRNTPKLWHLIGVDYISGERILPKNIFDNHLDEISLLKPFGFEVFLNRLIIKNKFRIKIVLWSKVDSPYKVKKDGWWRGIKGDFFMMLDIFKTISIFGPIHQIIELRKLMVK